MPTKVCVLLSTVGSGVDVDCPSFLLGYQPYEFTFIKELSDSSAKSSAGRDASPEPQLLVLDIIVKFTT